MNRFAEDDDYDNYHQFTDEGCDLTPCELAAFTQGQCAQFQDLDDDMDDFEEDSPWNFDSLSQHFQSTQTQLDEDINDDVKEEDGDSDIIEVNQPEENSAKRQKIGDSQREDLVRVVYAQVPDKPYYADRQFHVGCSYNHKSHITRIYTIAKFDEKVHNLAYCFIYVPIEEISWIGSEKSLKVSHVKLRRIKKVNIVDLRKKRDTPQTNLILDLSPKSTKGVGWEEAIYFEDLSRGVAKDGTCEVIGTPTILNSKPTVLDCFAGAGGMSLGFVNAGFDVTHAIEYDPLAAATLEKNHFRMGHGNIDIYQEDMRDFLDRLRNPSNHPAYAHLLEQIINHVHCSSPCQGFSKANRTGGKNDVANNELSLCFPELLKIWNADTGSFENVTGMLDPKKIQYLRNMIDKLVLYKYQVRIGVLRSSDYGDPQNRERLFVFAAKAGKTLPNFPKASHGEDENLLPRKTCKDCIGDLADVTPLKTPGRVLVGDYFVSHHIEPGKRDKNQKEKPEKLKANRPAMTIRATNQVEHYQHARPPTIRELARFQSFPDEYEFCGSHTAIRLQVGNAVPVGLATAVAKVFCPCYENTTDYKIGHFDFDLNKEPDDAESRNSDIASLGNRRSTL